MSKRDRHEYYGVYERYFKRPLDFFLSLMAIIVLSPVYIIVAVLVRLKLGSPILFTQTRPGLNEKLFKLYKFRTMTNKCDEKGNLLPDSVRLTTFGKKLRATSLDELPELFNILKGDMSVIGPRPLLVSYLPYYTDEERKRHDVRPGLSGLAQVSGRNNLDWDHRLSKDVEYVNHITFIGDTKIVIETIKQVFRHKDVTVDTSNEGNLAEIRAQEDNALSYE